MRGLARKTAGAILFGALAIAALPVAAHADATVSQSAGALDVPAGSAGGTDLGIANPFPSTINIASPVGTVTGATATLTNVTHGHADDFDIVLSSPNGVNVLLWSDACGGAMPPTTFTFDDAAPTFLSNGGPCAAGSYMPSNYLGGGDLTDDDSMPAPGPQETAYTNKFSAFNGGSPVGAWKLWAYDDDNGTAATTNSIGGWTLNLKVNPTNTFTLGSVVRNRDGTGSLTATVPNPGSLLVEDGGSPPSSVKASAAKKKKKKVSGPMVATTTVNAAAAGAVTLPINPTAAALKRLNKGKAVPIKVKVTYTPTGGSANSLTVNGTLKKAKKKKKKK